jgi:hypothetical protein
MRKDGLLGDIVFDDRKAIAEPAFMYYFGFSKIR